ncbi:MAG TPA: LuxR C-terminal-related transcriptional regulator [Solirubrobacterales bacterium]|jgi:DNA-binding CsgD family transcriptional regulator|nr:LuxR C-terminal-related transcriptional regulator [Solirubrobacterales bacterium]
MVIVDDQRRYLQVNWPALLTFRLSLAEMRRLRIDDLTPPDSLGEMAEAWKRLMERGSTTGPYRVGTPDGGRFDLYFWGLANALPGKHVIAFALESFDDDLRVRADEPPTQSPLTPRELELLRLAADGLSGPQIAEQLVLSPATVRTHFGNIYGKLDVGDRASAVAKAMRLGLIE